MINRLFLFLTLVFSVITLVHAGGEKELKKSVDVSLYKLTQIEKRIDQEPELAIEKLENEVEYAINHNNKESIWYAYFLMGRAYKQLGQPQIALYFMRLSENNFPVPSKLSAKIKTTTTKEVTFEVPPKYYSELAEIHALLGNYELSNKNYKVFQTLQKDEDVSHVNLQIAQNWYALEAYNQAINVYEVLLNYAKSIGDEELIRACYSGLAACKISLGQTEEGLALYKLSLRGLEDQEEQRYQKINSSKELVSQALRKQSKFDEELAIRNEALNLINNGLEYLRLAQAYYIAKNYRQSEESLDQYFNEISYDLIDEQEIQVIKEMAERLGSQNKTDKAFQYLSKYEMLSDTIFSKRARLQKTSDIMGAKGYQDALRLEVLQKDKQISNNAINHLMRESELKEDLVGFQKTIIYLLCGIILIGIIVFVYIVRINKQRRKANQQLALRSLRSQMNPHFIFNALNSVNSFISLSDERSANKFLTEFSTLMRTVMELSEYDFIPVSKELEIIQIYLDLEHFRFKDKFDYQLTVSEELNIEDLTIPPMLIQPYIENAIWHGLRYKEEKGLLEVNITRAKGKLAITIKDNGIGRAKSKEIKTKNQKKTKSTAMRNIEERVQLINSLHKLKIEVQIHDLRAPETGTLVVLEIPQS